LKLHRAGTALDPDLNKYDLNHVCTAHSRMTQAEWERAYRLAWQRYYTTEHIETVLRRVASAGANASNALFLITWFKGSIDYENIHPLESGFLRLKFRRDRRTSFAMESIWQFYPRYFAESAVKLVRWVALYLRLRRIYLRIKRDPQRFAYTDLAMSPIADGDLETPELLGTDSARAYVHNEQRLQHIREGSIARPDRATAEIV
jgi:hypothetical protein